jgi:peptide/nickel transport system substrate-binding protein
VNVSGYSNPAFDAACGSALQSLPDEVGYAPSYRDAQTIFADDLPSIPLYWRLKVAASRPDLCNFQLDPTAASALWNIEGFDYGTACTP